METSASTGRAEGIADGDMVSVKENLGVNCKSASQANKVRGSAESATYI